MRLLLQMAEAHVYKRVEFTAEDWNAAFYQAKQLDDVLVEIAEYLEDCSDVRDGPDGEQVPNRAMSLLQELEPLLPAQRGDVE